MACTNHPLVATGISQCWVCARDFCPDCVVEFQSRTMCGPCKAEAVARLEAGQSAVATQGEKAPWERRSELGLVQAFVQTTKAVLTEPQGFFERLDKDVTTYECLLFPMIPQTIASIVAWLFSLLFVGASAAFLGGASGGRPNPFAGLFGAGVLGVFQVVLAPIGAVIGVYIWAGLIHLFLAMTKKAGAPFQQTMRGVCYAQAPTILGLIPLLGPIVGFFWCLVTYVFMVMKVHRVSGGNAVAAVLALPLLLACCCGGVYAALVASILARH